MALQKKFKIDWLILGPVLILLTIGGFAVYSATINSPVEANFIRQMVWTFAAIFLAITLYFIDVKTFQFFAILLYGITLALLVSVLLFGKEVYGSKSWLYLGPIGIQPSEFAKYTTLLMFASYMSFPRPGQSQWLTMVIGISIILVPVFLIMGQPDTGTALVFLGMLLPILFWIGLEDTIAFFFVSSIISAVAAFINFYIFIVFLVFTILFIFFRKMNLWLRFLTLVSNFAAGFGTVFVIENIFLPHQRKRMEILLDPFIDPKGAGYNIIQSEVAIGSGGFFGKGFLNGTQTQLGFLPKQWTDFIFCVVAEEYGLVGATILLIIFVIFLYRILSLSYIIKNRFASIFLIGSFMIFLIHLIINVGMTMGILPIIGIPLPFVSYGGSSMITFMAFVGTILAIYAQQTAHEL